MKKELVMLFLFISFILFVGSVFIFVRNEDSNSKKALDKVTGIDNRFQNQIDRVTGAEQFMSKNLEETREILDKMVKKIEWLELKSSAPQVKIVQSAPLAPIKVEPIQLQVVYRMVKKKRPIPKEDPVRAKTIKSLKEKMKSVNQ